MLEVEHPGEVEPDALRPVGLGENLISGARDPRQAPVVLDEVEDRGLVCEVVVDVVDARVRRDHEHREPGAEATATLLAGEWLLRLRARAALA